VGSGFVGETEMKVYGVEVQEISIDQLATVVGADMGAVEHQLALIVHPERK